MDSLLSGHVAVVTGGGRDLGRDISLALAEEGADVAVCGRTLGPLEETAREVQALGRQSMSVVADLTREQDVIELFRVAVDRFGFVSLLVNNAASARLVSSVADMPLDGWTNAIATKLTGAMLCSREALKSMVTRKSGNIINISGTTGIQAPANISAHAVAQRGLVALTQSLSKEVGQHGVRVNAVMPGAIEGEGLRRQMAVRREQGEDMQDRMRGLAASSPLGRLVQPREVTDAVVFLASERSSGLTGQTIDLLL